MRVGIAYLGVVLVWSTTPLGISWSNDSFSFIEAIALRVVLAALLSALIMAACGEKLVKRSNDWWVFAASALGLFPGMFLVYWSAQYIATGLIAVILGFYPFAVGFFSQIILKEKILNKEKFVALFVALLGLAAINYDQLHLSFNAALGVIAVVFSAIVWAYSTVVVKKSSAEFHPFRMGTGTLVVASPIFIVLWFLIDGTVPEYVSETSLFGVVYLVLGGSLLGHTLFFYVLRNCSVGSVSLIPLITPVLALILGYLIEGESLSATSLLGAALILVSLGIYQGMLKFVYRKLNILYAAVV